MALIASTARHLSALCGLSVSLLARLPRWARVGAAAVSVTVCATPAKDAAAAPNTPAGIRIRIRGHAHVDAHVARDLGREAGRVSLSGSVVDDAGRPVLGAKVAISLAHAHGQASSPPPGASERIPLGPTFPEACDLGAAEPELDRQEPHDAVVLATDEAARFCVSFDLPTDRYTAHVQARPTSLVDGAALDLAVDLSLPPVTLRFVPERSILSLDDDKALVTVLASVDPSLSTAGLALRLTNESGAALGSATTDGSGLARFSVDAPRLGPPGAGELRVTFAGNGRLGAAGQAVRIERRARVVLDAPDAIANRLPAGVPEEGIPIKIAASLACAKRGCIGSPGGVVEASIASEGAIGATPVVAGTAQLVVTFATPGFDGAAGELSGAPAAGASVPITLRYIPDAPWFLPSGPLALAQPLRAPSAWRKAPLLAAGLAVVAWLVLLRLPSRPRPRRRAAPIPKPAPEGGIAVVHSERTPDGWVGRVTDGHDHRPIPGARIAIERRDFEHIHLVAETTADGSGAFALAPIEVHAGDELVADAPHHAKVGRPLPPSGTLSVVLVLRRRALLDRLVAWARRQGPPFASPLEPTPGHVRRAASTDGAVARWATAVEEAAYGKETIDEGAEAAVDRLAPPGAAGRSTTPRTR